MTLSRRVRGTLGTAVVWSLVFAVAGIVCGLVTAAVLVIRYHMPSVPWPELVTYYLRVIVTQTVPRWAMMGAASGALFALVLSVRARGRTLETLEPRRFAGLGLATGAIAASLVAAIAIALTLWTSPLHGVQLLVDVALIPVLGGLVGGATATAMLRTARRGELAPVDDARALPDAR
jgi:hypothetical protein